jgi:hypothetical protein
MTSPTNQRLVLTSVNQLIKLVQNNPELSAKLPRFSQIASMSSSTTPKKSCNCGGRVNVTTPDRNKQIAENLLTSLSPQDFTTIKNTLNLKELCYYKRSAEEGTLTLICT